MSAPAKSDVGSKCRNTSLVHWMCVKSSRRDGFQVTRETFSNMIFQIRDHHLANGGCERKGAIGVCKKKSLEIGSDLELPKEVSKAIVACDWTDFAWQDWHVVAFSSGLLVWCGCSGKRFGDDTVIPFAVMDA